MLAVCVAFVFAISMNLSLQTHDWNSFDQMFRERYSLEVKQGIADTEAIVGICWMPYCQGRSAWPHKQALRP